MSYQRGAYGHGDYKGWQTTTDDYYVHVSRMERMPSTIVEAPRFPNFHTLFNNKKIANTTTTTDHEDVHEDQVVVQKEEPSETTKSSTVQVPPQKKVVQSEKQIKDSSSNNNKNSELTPVSTVQVPEAQKKVVQFEEQTKDSKITKKKKNGKKQQGYESNIDVEATDFIQNKHKNFELSKWMSLRGY